MAVGLMPVADDESRCRVNHTGSNLDGGFSVGGVFSGVVPPVVFLTSHHGPTIYLRRRAWATIGDRQRIADLGSLAGGGETECGCQCVV